MNDLLEDVVKAGGRVEYRTVMVRDDSTWLNAPRSLTEPVKYHEEKVFERVIFNSYEQLFTFDDFRRMKRFR